MAQHISKPVEADVRALKEKLETVPQLSRMEARFLQSLVVRHWTVILIDIKRWQVSSTAKEPSTQVDIIKSQSTLTKFEPKMQRIHFEMLLQEYKYTNDKLTTEIDALGRDSSSLGHGWTREALIHLEKLCVKAQGGEKQ